jgi:hypothetical protein
MPHHAITGQVSSSPFELAVLASATLSLAAVLIIPILLGFALVIAAVITWPRAAPARSCRSDTAPSPPVPPAASPPPRPVARRRLRPPALHHPAGTATS